MNRFVSYNLKIAGFQFKKKKLVLRVFSQHICFQLIKNEIIENYFPHMNSGVQLPSSPQCEVGLFSASVL